MAVALALLMMTAVPPPARARPGLSNVVDLSGRPTDPLDIAGGMQATVLVFTRTDCPIANRLLPVVERLRGAYEPRRVRFWLVFVDPSEPVASIRDHLAAFGQHSTAIRDPRHELVKTIGATHTPEAAVFVHDGPRSRLVYRGRIDNKFVDVGRTRRRATSHDLQDALEAALTGRADGAPRITQPVGCVIADLE